MHHDSESSSLLPITSLHTDSADFSFCPASIPYSLMEESLGIYEWQNRKCSLCKGYRKHIFKRGDNMRNWKLVRTKFHFAGLTFCFVGVSHMRSSREKCTRRPCITNDIVVMQKGQPRLQTSRSISVVFLYRLRLQFRTTTETVVMSGCRILRRSPNSLPF